MTDISCGDAHNLALVTIGNIYSWGDNSAGQLGTPHTYTDITKPRQIAVGTTSVVISQVACGANFSAALTSESGCGQGKGCSGCGLMTKNKGNVEKSTALS